MGTGLGPESYALIEQGRIGQILSSRPTDRRAIIEEAAGITKFKTKKRLAEARLEDAKLNLSRVNDIFEEVTRQMNSLKRQASRPSATPNCARKCGPSCAWCWPASLPSWSRRVQRSTRRSAPSRKRCVSKAETVQQSEAEHAERTQRGYAIETEVRENRERLSQLKLESDRAQAQRRHNEERCAELVERAAAFEAEFAQAQQRLAALAAERDGNRQILDSAAGDLAAAQQELSQSQHEAAAAAAALAELEHQQEQSRAHDCGSSCGRFHFTKPAHPGGRAAGGSGSRGATSAVGNGRGNSQMETFGGQRGQLGLEFETVSQRVSGLTEELRQTSKRSTPAPRRVRSQEPSRQPARRDASAIGKKGRSKP